MLCEVEIRSTMRDLKLANEEQGLGLTSFPCPLCDAGKSDMRDPERIQSGFPINRSTEKMRHEKCLYEPYGLESPKNGNYRGYSLFEKSKRENYLI